MIPTFNIPAADVQDLTFERVSEDLSHKWAIFEVSFTLEGKRCIGFLGATPQRPQDMHDDMIEDCEVDF